MGSGKFKPTGAWRSDTNPRWGIKYSDPEVMKMVNKMADRVGDTEPTDLRRCQQCGGWATKNCSHLTT